MFLDRMQLTFFAAFVVLIFGVIWSGPAVPSLSAVERTELKHFRMSPGSYVKLRKIKLQYGFSTEQTIEECFKTLYDVNQQLASIRSVINLPEESKNDLVETFRLFVTEKVKLKEQLDEQTQQFLKLQIQFQQLTLDAQQKDETIEKLRRQLDFFRNELKNANRENRDQ